MISINPGKRSAAYFALLANPGEPAAMKKDNHHNEIRTESLLRETTTHYIRLIGDADRKARIMIVVNSILLTISITLLTKTIDHGPPIWISTTTLIISNLSSLFFAVISVKPEIQVSIGKDTENNILHYKKCSEFSLRDYRAEMLATMEDNDKKINAIIKELHYFGNLLTRKYKLLKTAYRFFYWGVMLSVTSYLIILAFTY